MKASELAEILLKSPNAEVSIVTGEDNSYEIREEQIYLIEHDGRYFIDIDVLEYKDGEPLFYLNHKWNKDVPDDLIRTILDDTDLTLEQVLEQMEHWQQDWNKLNLKLIKQKDQGIQQLDWDKFKEEVNGYGTLTPDISCFVNEGLICGQFIKGSDGIVSLSQEVNLYLDPEKYPDEDPDWAWENININKVIQELGKHRTQE